MDIRTTLWNRAGYPSDPLSAWTFLPERNKPLWFKPLRVFLFLCLLVQSNNILNIATSYALFIKPAWMWNQYRRFSTFNILDIVTTTLSLPAPSLPPLCPLSRHLPLSLPLPSLFLSLKRQFLLLWWALKSFQLQCWKLKEDRYKQSVAMMLVLWTFPLWQKRVVPHKTQSNTYF